MVSCEHEAASGDDSSSPKRAQVSCEEGASPDDVATYIGASTNIANDGKYQLLVNHFKPGPDYKFPRGVHGRTFQYRWLQHYPWLAYSKQKNGGFCLLYVLFATCGYHQSTPGVLVQRPLTSFAKALELFCKHADTAVVRADEFLKVMRNQQSDIHHRISQTLADRVHTNRQILA